MVIDLTLDYEVIDELENVTLDGGAVPNAYRLPDQIQEGDSTEGAYLHRDIVWQLPTSPAITPVVGSILVSGGVEFVVQEVREPFAGDYWGLRTREVSITADATLHDLITLFPVVVTAARDGSRIATHPDQDPVFADIPGKIVPMPGEIDVIAGKQQFRRAFEIYVQTEVTTLSIGDLLEDQDLNRYDVVSWRDRERIDQLSVILAEFRD